MAEAAIHTTHEVVSSEEEPLILVDESDREIGHLSKGECHNGDGVLHRAFSLFIFNSDGEPDQIFRDPFGFTSFLSQMPV